MREKDAWLFGKPPTVMLPVIFPPVDDALPSCFAECGSESALMTHQRCIPVFRPARTSMSVVLPAPELPIRAVSTPGSKAPLQSRSSRSIVVLPTTAA